MRALDVIALTRLVEMDLPPPVRVTAGTVLGEVVQAMRQARSGAALVETGDGRLIGIFTENDLMMRVRHDDPRWRECPVAEVMTADPVVATADGTIGDALRSMAGGRRHMPVVDTTGRVLALVSIREILQHFAERFPKEFLNLPPDARHEAYGAWGG